MNKYLEKIAEEQNKRTTVLGNISATTGGLALGTGAGIVYEGAANKKLNDRAQALTTRNNDFFAEKIHEAMHPRNRASINLDRLRDKYHEAAYIRGDDEARKIIDSAKDEFHTANDKYNSVVNRRDYRAHKIDNIRYSGSRAITKNALGIAAGGGLAGLLVYRSLKNGVSNSDE